MSPDDPRLTALLDRQAVLDVVFGYVDRVDALDPDALTALFLPDATVDLMGYTREGAEGIGRHLGRTLAQFEATSHHVTNPLVTLDAADVATVSAAVYAWHLRPTSEWWHFWGRYTFRLQQVEGSWRIAHLQLVGIGGGPDASPAERALYTGHPDRPTTTESRS